jgi:predicted MFS family arabinose efflux permease
MTRTTTVQQRVSAACPVIDHDIQAAPAREARPGLELSPTCVRIMAAAGGIAVANLYYNQPMLADIGATFGASARLTALLPTLTQIGYALGLFFFVPLGDLVDRRRLVLALLGGVIVALIGLAVAPSLEWLAAASLVVGLFSVLAQVLVAMAGQLAPPHARGSVIGKLQAGILLGILLARTVSGTVSEYFGWRSMFWLAAALATLLTIVLYRVLPHAPPTTSLFYPRALLSLKDLWQRYPELRRASLVGALLFAAFSTFWSTLAYRLSQPDFGYGPQAAGLFGLLGAVGALTAPLAGRLTDWRGAKLTVALGSITTAAAFPIFAFGDHSLVLLGVGVIVLDIGIQASMIGNQSTVLSLAPDATSRSNTIYMVLYFVGGATGSATAGMAWHHFGWIGVSAAGFIYAALAVIVHFTAARAKGR